MRHFMKKCEEFTLCGSNGDANYLYTHSYPENYAIYHIIIKGRVKMCRPFENNYVTLDVDKNKFVDVKDYLYDHRVYLSDEPYYMFGFNALDPRQDWDGKLLQDSFVGDNRSWLICFDGKPIINGTSVKPMDYAKLDNKHYDVELNNAVVGIFTKL